MLAVAVLDGRMQNAKGAQRDNGAASTRLTNPKKLWGPRLSILCPVPSGEPQTWPIPHPPTYAVQTCQQHPNDQRWTAKLSHFKPLLCLHRTVQLFCNFHSDRIRGWFYYIFIRGKDKCSEGDQ